jgi:DNA-binding NarL/FixJ family response regulator
MLVRAMTGLEDWDGAKTALVELTNIAAIVNTLPLKAAVSFASGHLALARGHADEGRQHFEDAVDRYLKSGAPFEAGRARTELARALDALGRGDDAAAELHRAIEVFSELKAELEIGRARGVMASLTQETTPPRGADRSGLTRREVEVLRLVAEGLNNQSIAGRLFVSDHTIHRHLANILGKLNVSTRAAAVAQAARRGILS